MSSVGWGPGPRVDDPHPAPADKSGVADPPLSDPFQGEVLRSLLRR
ncbi:MAG: hypothetical protein QOD29_2863 [Alphaproteobacteria bacterium]|jgi:hypothetical protein|nr:hypothetical protein [Alphaproteobacteria bacterium]